MSIYVLGIIFVLYKCNFWDASLIKDSIAWFVVVGLIMLMTANKALDNPKHFRKVIWENVKFTIYLEFIINLYVFSLPMELVLSFVIILFSILSLVGSRVPKSEGVVKFLNGTLALLGFGLLGWVIYKVASDYNNFATLENLRDFLYPVLLGLAYIPFLYLYALFMYYQYYYKVRISYGFQKDEEVIRYAKLKIFRTARFNMSKLRCIDKNLNIFLVESKAELDHKLKEICS